MVKVENLGMDLLYFQNSKTWDYGTYKILSSDLKNYGAKKADGTYDEAILERILYSHSNKALNQIKKDIDTKGVLNVFTWSDLTGSRFIEALPLIMEAQLSGMITDGNKEIKKGSSYTGGGVDASIDASGFLLSHDRIYKAAEDVWFNYQLDKYEIEEGEDEHGNTTYSLIDNAEGTVKTIVATILLTPEQEKTIIDKTAQKISSNSKFDLVNINGKDVIQPKDGRDILLVDDSGVPIVPSSPNSAASVAVAEQKAQEASKDKADKADVDAKVAIIQAAADAKYVLKSYDFTDTPNALTLNITNGVHFVLISQTPEQASAPIGSETRLIITNPATPAEIPTDDAVLAYGLDVVYKEFDIIAQLRAKWVDVKDNIANGKVMVLKRLDDHNGDKRWVIEKWEDKQIEPHWETIDQTTYNFTEIDAGRIVKIHWGAHNSITGHLSYNNGNFEITVPFEVSSTTIFSMFWGSGKTDKSKLDRIQQKNTGFTYDDDHYPITKFEIWKEV